MRKIDREILSEKREEKSKKEIERKNKREREEEKERETEKQRKRANVTLLHFRTCVPLVYLAVLDCSDRPHWRRS